MFNLTQLNGKLPKYQHNIIIILALYNITKLLKWRGNYVHTNIHTYIHTNIHTYIHTNIHTYIHTNIHTYIHIYCVLQYTVSYAMTRCKTLSDYQS